MKILLVEDDIQLRDVIIEDDLFKQHKTILASNGKQALEQIKIETPDIILLDIEMPILDGISVLRMIKANEEYHHIPVIMISGLIDSEKIVQCIELGADDYLIKPFNSVMLKARVRAGLRNKQWREKELGYLLQIEDYNENLQQKVNEQVKQITAAQDGLIFAMATLTEARDPETGEHLIRIREYCKVIAQTLSENPKFKGTIDDDYISNIYTAAPLHDIGKVAIPDKILQKKGALNEDEFEVMKMHTELGADTLRKVYKHHSKNDLLKIGIQIAENHHEHWDGSGYPAGLKKDEIPLAARILTLADAYDAITAKRIYKEAYSHDFALKIIIEDNGKHFDPDIVEAFLSVEKKVRGVLMDSRIDNYGDK